MSIRLKDLVSRAASGDAAARERLMTEIYPQVERMVHRELEHGFRRNHRWMLPLFSTGDIVQEVFVGVVQSMPTPGEHDDPQLLAWLAAQVKNRIIDRLRFHLAHRRDARQVRSLERRSDEGSLGMPARDRTPSTMVALDERMRLLQSVLRELDERGRELWRLRVDEECAFADIATALEYPNSEAARSGFRHVQAKVALRLHKLGVRDSGAGSAP